MGMGVIWVLMAAVLLGFYALPSKYMTNYTSDNTWGGFWLLAMFIVPLLATFSLVDGLGATYAQVSSSVFASVIALSILWGIGNLLWGISISKIGMALGFSLLIGISTLVGSVLPFFMGGLEKLSTPGGMVILAGIVIIMLGIIANGKAGLIREKFENKDKRKEKSKASAMKVGITMCIVGGLCAAGFNLSYHVADNIGHIGAISQEQFGNPPWIARLAVMLPSFIGSGIATVLFYIILLSKNKTWGNFAGSDSAKNLGLLIIMALIYCASLIIYGLGAYKLGALGTSVGFAIFQTGCIMVANLLGVFTGEWKNAGSESQKWLWSGLGVMCIGIIVVAYGNGILA